MTQTVIIESLGRQGDGIAAGPIYVPLALPGETVAGTVIGDQMVAAKIIEPSPDRVRPPCKHFKACGGCQMQHSGDVLVADWKRSLVTSALKHNGLRTDVRDVITSDSHSRRRATIAARRTRSGALAGFHARRSNEIVDVTECAVVAGTLSKSFALARDLAVLGASRKSELNVRCTETLDGLDVHIEGGKDLDEELRHKLPPVLSQSSVARATWAGEIVFQSASPRIRFGEVDVSLPPNAFLQATKHGEVSLQHAAMEAVEGARSFADLFAGCGTFSLILADRGQVHSVEGDAAMVAALQSAANMSSLRHPVTSEVRNLYQNPLVADEFEPFEAVVINPPRAGAVAQVQELTKSKVPVIAYVSCDPVTFARDAAELCRAGYVLDWIQPVDQFRWSTHIELVARLCLPHMQHAG